MLFVLKKAKKKLCNNILKAADTELIKALCDCVMNVLNGNVQTGGAAKRRLSKYKKELRTIASSKRNLASKRRLIIQRGGLFLPTLLNTLLNGVVGAYLLNRQ